MLLNPAVTSVQTGYSFAAASAGAGEDASYVDVAISAVDVAKAVVLWQDSNAAYPATARLTSPTNLRIAIRTAAQQPAGRWTVIQFS